MDALDRLAPAEIARGGWAVTPQPAPLGVAEPAGEGLVCVARLGPLKGVDRAIRLAAALNWPLRVVGDGAARPSLEALAAETGASVEFTGRLSRVDALQAYRGRAANLLLPRVDVDGSGAEGFGVVLLEGMGWGVPAVGCATGGVPEAVGPGLLLSSPDDPVASAAALTAWLGDKGRGAEAWAWARDHHGRARAARVALEALG